VRESKIVREWGKQKRRGRSEGSGEVKEVRKEMPGCDINLDGVSISSYNSYQR